MKDNNNHRMNINYKGGGRNSREMTRTTVDCRGMNGESKDFVCGFYDSQPLLAVFLSHVPRRCNEKSTLKNDTESTHKTARAGSSLEP